jgi:hypothetical protein
MIHIAGGIILAVAILWSFSRRPVPVVILLTMGLVAGFLVGCAARDACAGTGQHEECARVIAGDKP